MLNKRGKLAESFIIVVYIFSVQGFIENECFSIVLVEYEMADEITNGINPSGISQGLIFKTPTLLPSHRQVKW